MTKTTRALLGLAVALGAATVAAGSDEPPAGLTRDDWSQIRGSIEESGYHAHPMAKPGDVAAFQAPNRRQQYRTTFRREGIEIVPQAPAGPSWCFGLSVTGYGYEGDVRPVTAVEPRALKQRVEYRRGPVTEWYVNRPGGLEQGFELAEPKSRRAEPVVVAMAMRGDLAMSAVGDGLSFAGRSGETLVYDGLKAWDAAGRPLRTRLAAVGREVHLVVESRGARFPITVDPTFVHEAQIFGRGDPSVETGAQFGYAVSVSGDTLVAGEPNRDTPGATDSGSAWVFVRSGTAWTLQQTLAASDRGAGDRFGVAVAVSGDTAVIGADGDDTPGGADSGSAYVFVRSGTVWTQQQKLLASDGTAGDGFGRTVSLSGDTVLVGAWTDDPVGSDSGSAYVFVRAATTWSQEQKLVAADGAAGHRFGFSVSVFGDTAVVGAILGAAGNGAAYVFVRSGGAWSPQQRLLASDGLNGDGFGWSVSVFSDTAVVGARYDQANGGFPDVGSAYVFVRSGATWSEQQHLVASDGLMGDGFGFSVSLSADTVAIGAPFDDVVFNDDDCGSAYVFVRSGGMWTEQQKIPGATGDESFGFSVAVSGDTLAAGANILHGPFAREGMALVLARSGVNWTRQQSLLAVETTLAGDGFGISVSASGNTVVIGASSDDGFGGANAGSAYVFVRSGTTWTEQQKLQVFDGASNDLFGLSVSVSGDTIVVGAPRDDTSGGTDAGSAYVFVRSGTTWGQPTKLLAPDGAANDAFGYSVAISGDTVVAGAYGDDIGGNGDVGSAYVFVRSGPTWTQQQKLPGLGGLVDDFGYSVAISGDTVIIGAPLADAGGGGIADAGAAVVYVRSGTTWTLQRTLFASDPVASDEFGFSVSVSGNTAVVGSVLDDTPAAETGSAYVFVRSGTTWTEQQKLVASDGAGGDGFGGSVSVSGDSVVIGASGDDTPGTTNVGSAYVFARSGTTWSQQQKLLAPDGAALDGFGVSVSLSGDTIVAGVPGDDTAGGADAGSAHVFREPPTADIAASIADSPDPVTPGANLVYTIVATNNGPDAALGVQVVLPTPGGLTFLANAGACTTPFPCVLGTVPAGQTRMITATFGVPSGYAGPNPIVATATATTTTGDPVPANNQAIAMTAVAPARADLSVVEFGPATVAAGSDIVYSITIDNGGPSDAAAVQVADPTPTGLTFVSNTGACTTPFPCALATVPSGQNRVVTATFHVPAGYSGPNPIVNQATVTSTTFDPNGSNNAATASTTVTFVPNLEPAAMAVDVAGNGVFQPNETVTVAPSWRNAGAAAVATVAGAASSFTGPAGPSYTIADAAATYGTIAPGVTASCTTDCYRLTNTTATRPATHWDATFLETITPGTSTKTWRLHIGDSFTDVPPTSGFYRFVETLLHRGITGGCNATQYCPTTTTTRDQMAVFVLVAKEGPGYLPPACTTPVFTDVPASSPFCRWIEELVRRGVAGGCGAGIYCPTAAVTREQMAVFVLRTLDPALNPPTCGTPVFADVPASSPFCKWIEELVRRGVVTGCGGGNYCPTAAVTREQMAVFLSVTFGLTLYGP